MNSDQIARLEAKFIGLGKRSSQNLAEAESLAYRLIRVDAESFLPYPEDIRTDRVCIEIDNLKVSKAKIQ